MVSDNSFEEIVNFPTRKQNTLDSLTTHPSFTQRCKSMPSIGNSDHDIVLFDTTITATRPKPPRRKILLWKKADIQGIRDDLSDLLSITNLNDPSIEDSWDRLKSKIQTSIENRVPSKMTTSRITHPWMNTEIKRFICRKQRAHKKARRSNQKRDLDRYKRIQKEVQYQIRKGNKKYLVDTVSHDFKDDSKKFWAFVKNKGEEATGVAPLKNKEGYLQTMKLELTFSTSN